MPGVTVPLRAARAEARTYRAPSDGTPYRSDERGVIQAEVQHVRELLGMGFVREPAMPLPLPPIPAADLAPLATADIPDPAREAGARTPAAPPVPAPAAKRAPGRPKGATGRRKPTGRPPGRPRKDATTTGG